MAFLAEHLADALITLILFSEACIIFPALNWWPHPLRWYYSLDHQDKFSFFVALSTTFLALFTGVLVIVGVLQWKVLARTDEAIHLTERPVVSLGRKDGTLAEFAVPDESVPDQNVGIKIYLQNGGQSAALTPNLGLLPLNFVFNGIGEGQSKPPKVPLQNNQFHHLIRSRDKNGGMTIGGGASIPPQSERAYFFPDQISREQYGL